MEIHQLEYFIAVEKYKNFSAASLEICTSQSTLSQQIKKLEDELGVKLFIRSARSVRLSAAGEEFLVHARRIVSEIQYSRETMQKYTNFDKGNIKIGVFPYIDYFGLNKVITNFSKKYPGIAVDIYVNNEDELLKALSEKKVNVAFVNSPFGDGHNLHFYPIVKDRLVTVVSADHPLANASIIDLIDLSHENFLMIESSSWFHNTLVQVCNDAGYDPKIILESGRVDMVRSFVEEGMGVALMGNRIAQCISNKNISIIPIRTTMEQQIGLAIPKYKQLPLSPSIFRDFILKELLMYE